MRPRAVQYSKNTRSVPRFVFQVLGIAPEPSRNAVIFMLCNAMKLDIPPQQRRNERNTSLELSNRMPASCLNWT